MPTCKGRDVDQSALFDTHQTAVLSFHRRAAAILENANIDLYNLAAPASERTIAACAIVGGALGSLASCGRPGPGSGSDDGYLVTLTEWIRQDGALETSKTGTAALLSLCWAKAHSMTLIVQDLTNPMLAQIPYVLLAAPAGAVTGAEMNAMQLYPQASAPEGAAHPELYRR